MTKDDIDRIEALLAKATQGEWEIDILKSEGEYGSGPDTVAGFEVSAIYDAQGRVIFDALNSDVIEVQEDYGDEDGYVYAYDLTSAANAALIVALHNAAPALIAAARENERLRGALVTAMIPIEAILLSGAEAAHCQDVRDALHDAVATARPALSTAKQETSDAD